MLRFGGSAARASLMKSQPSRMFVRQNSTASAIAKVNSLVATAKSIADQSIFWAKVTAEVGKQIYLKEGLAPPTVAQFQSTFTSLYSSALPYIFSPEKALGLLKSINTTSVIKYSCYGIQVLGAFSLGEIIGRRKVVGY
ncbi:mitochondrial ATP synthase g subunit-domain-containing protein [Dipodascopsis uninucleata]